MHTVEKITNDIDDIIKSFSKDRISSHIEGGVDKLKRFSHSAPNIVEWVTRPEYLNFNMEEEGLDKIKTLFEHYGQYQTVRDFFELLCPICAKPEDRECWGKSRESLESQPLLVWNLQYKDDECPQCKTTRKELRDSGLLQGFDIMLLIVGMRAAKSMTAGLIATWVEHKILTLDNVQKFFGQAPRQLFEVSFVATTAKQSEKTVYEAYRGLRENSPWLKQYLRVLKSLEKFKGELYEETNGKIKYNHANVLFESMNSNSSGVAGGTRIASFIDELARFDTTESKRSAKEIYRVFSQGLRTIRSVRMRKVVPNCFGVLVSTTSPVSVNDYAMKLSEKATNVRNMFFVHKSTWEFNPYEPFENFKDDFDLDPVGAQRDFGAVPPNAERPLIFDVDKFNQCVDHMLKPTATFLDNVSKDPLGREYVGKGIEFCQVDTKTKKVLVGDAGKDRDSFALACAHGEWRLGEGGRKWMTIFDWVLTTRPLQVPKRIVSFDAAEQLIKDVAKKQRIVLVRFDKWNSASIIQALRFDGIDSDNLSVKAEHYVNFMQDAYEDKIRLLPPKEDDVGKDPYLDMSDEGRAIHELLSLERSLDLKKVDHRSGEHNDLAVCVVGCHWLVQNEMKIHGSSRDSSADTERYVGAIGKFRRW